MSDIQAQETAEVEIETPEMDGVDLESFDDDFEDMVSADDNLDDLGDEDTSEIPLFKRKQMEEEKKKSAKGQTNDDMKIVERLKQDEEEESEEDEEVEEVSAKKEDKKKEEEVAEEKKVPAPKGKRLSLKVGEETFAIDNTATIPHKVDGKVVDVPVQELLNNYSGKVAWDKRMNEVNVKNQEIVRKAQEVEQRESRLTAQAKEVMDIVNDPEKNPMEALYKLVDLQNGDRYDFWERSFKTQLEELSTVLGMKEVERRAYFLEKKNEFLTQQTEKRKTADAESQKLNRYREQANALRKSYGVNETQYVEAYEEIKSWGYEPKDISEKQIVEWASIKPHKQTLDPLMEQYREAIDEDSFGELQFKLSTYLRDGQETLESIAEQLEEAFGAPKELKELNKELKPLGRPKSSGKQSTISSKKLESFDDWDEE